MYMHSQETNQFLVFKSKIICFASISFGCGSLRVQVIRNHKLYMVWNIWFVETIRHHTVHYVTHFGKWLDQYFHLLMLKLLFSHLGQTICSVDAGYM